MSDQMTDRKPGDPVAWAFYIYDRGEYRIQTYPAELKELTEFQNAHMMGKGVFALIPASDLEAAAALRQSPSVEEVARVIDPWPAKNWQGLYDYAISVGDSVEQAVSLADWAHGAARDEVLAKAAAIDRLYRGSKE